MKIIFLELLLDPDFAIEEEILSVVHEELASCVAEHVKELHFCNSNATLGTPIKSNLKNLSLKQTGQNENIDCSDKTFCSGVGILMMIMQ